MGNVVIFAGWFAAVTAFVLFSLVGIWIIGELRKYIIDQSISLHARKATFRAQKREIDAQESYERFKTDLAAAQQAKFMANANDDVSLGAIKKEIPPKEEFSEYEKLARQIMNSQLRNLY